MSRDRALAIAGAALLIIGLAFILAALSIWVTGPHKLALIGLTVSLTDWTKPWWIGTSLIVLRLCLIPGPLPASQRLAAAARRLDALIRPRAEQGTEIEAVVLWEDWGAVIGGVVGVFFALHYYYLAPGPLGVAAAVLALAVGAMAHRHCFLALDALLRMAGAWLDQARRRNLITTIYLLIWAALVAGPLVRWEARFTEPVFTQGLFALAAGLAGLAVWRKSRRGLWWWYHRKWRRRVLVSAAVAVVLGMLWSIGTMGPMVYPSAGQAVILITLDTTRADHLSCYGYPRKTTPNLDALATSGVRFTRAFAPMAATDPSHLSMLTGWYPRTNGVRVPMSGHMPVSAPSLAETFLDHGYATAAITSRIMLDPWRLGLTGFQYVSVPDTQDTSAAEAYRRAMNWLTKNRDRNVFLWVHFFDPHQPYVRRPGFTEKFGPAPDASIAGGKWLDPSDHYTPDEIQERIDYYDGEIAYMDYYIGQLLQGIAELHPSWRGGKTLLVVMGDHGEMLGEKLAPPVGYGFGHGGVIYDAATRIPWIMAGSGRPSECLRKKGSALDNNAYSGGVPGKLAIQAVAETVDLAPTLSDFLWCEPYKCQGHSLVPLFYPDAPTSSNLAFIQRDDTLGQAPRPFLTKEQYAVIQWPWKLFYTPDSPLELYDLSQDPNENHNLASEQPSQADELKRLWDHWAEITPNTPSETHNLTPAELNNLKNLGYIQ
jgi:arylsulfatase A-like enzyme